MHLTQAADIHVQRFILTPLQNSESPSKTGILQADTFVAMLIKNFGHTRAERFTNDLVMGIQGQPTQLPQPRNEIALAIGADQDLKIGFGSIGDALTPQGLASVLEGIVPFKIWGSMNFYDVFGKHYRIRCEATYDIRSNDFLIDRYEHEKDERDKKTAKAN